IYQWFVPHCSRKSDWSGCPQGSGILTSMARANCLIRLSPDTKRVESGERVRLRLMDASPLW
ncbi:MAG: hypothetical protein EBV53_09475, partial [Proteobacteria bacterium]|nr:hypothetical protein [Pseudomonadota bacterium]